MKEYYVYILTSRSGTLYTGMTSDLQGRVWQHKEKVLPGFTSKYSVGRLVYYESYDRPADAIAREKQIKSWRRARKLALIEDANPEWRDLSEGWYDGP